LGTDDSVVLVTECLGLLPDTAAQQAWASGLADELDLARHFTPAAMVALLQRVAEDNSKCVACAWSGTSAAARHCGPWPQVVGHTRQWASECTCLTTGQSMQPFQKSIRLISMVLVGLKLVVT
jgi:hypothetical protein